MNKNLKYPICIISKDRADSCTTHLLFEPYGIDYFYMVEPNDYELYVAQFGKSKVVNIGENDKGVYYVRNFCIQWSIEKGYDKHWQIDDDLTSLHFRPMNNLTGIRESEKIKNPLKMILYMETMSDRFSNYGGSCLSHDGFAFAKNKDIDLNKMVYCFQLIRNSISAKYKPNTSEDIDFSITLLKEGYITLVFNKYTFRTPSSGSRKGGCNSSVDYKKTGTLDGRKKRNLKLCETYPQWFTEYTKKGQSELKPSRIWRSFKQKPILKA
tara:strand:- start:773 stop:1576 length:804 start_codon:yes stop_codon:yes gene_type:complete